MSYSNVGVLQYLSPSISLVLGVLVLHEPFPLPRAFGFALIWLALALYASDGVLARRQQVAR